MELVLIFGYNEETFVTPGPRDALVGSLLTDTSSCHYVKIHIFSKRKTSSDDTRPTEL